MSYLSRVRLKPEIRQSSQLALLLTENSYGMHRLLWDLFPGRDGQQRDFLFREERENEQGGSKHQPIFYLLSPEPPLQDSPLFQVDTKPFCPQLEEGDQLAFRLRANPVISRKTEGKKRSVPHDVVMDAQQQCLHTLCLSADIQPPKGKGDKQQALKALPKERLQAALNSSGLPDEIRSVSAALEWSVRQAQIGWISGKRAERNGYLIERPDNLRISGYQWRTLNEKRRHAGFSSLDYEGVLTVTDPERFVQTLNSGIGKARAFGCGLMLIRRC